MTPVTLGRSVSNAVGAPASGAHPPVWGSVESTVAAVVEALREGGAAPPPAGGSRQALPGRSRRRWRPGAASQLQRLAAWEQRWSRPRRMGRWLRATGSILDVGCYEGGLASRLAQATGRPVMGVDIFDSGFARAFEHAGQRGVEHLVGCVRADAHHLSALGVDLFEVATLTYSLHCMRDPGRVMGEVARVLAPGGVVLVVDWVVGEDEAKHGCSRLRMSEVRQMIEQAGLVMVQATSQGGVAVIAGRRPGHPHDASRASEGGS